MNTTQINWDNAIVVLNDGGTYTNARGCKIVIFQRVQDIDELDCGEYSPEDAACGAIPLTRVLDITQLVEVTE